MSRALLAVRRSLFARLLLIFLGTALALGLLDNLAERLIDVERPYKRLLREHLSRYVDYLAADLGSPPQVQRAATLVAELPLDIRIEGPGISWASHPDFPALAALHFNGRDRARQWGPGPRHYLRVVRDGYTMVFATPPFGYSFERRPAGYVMLIGSLAILALCYLLVRRLLAPIRLLRDGVQRIGAGELAHRVPVRRGDELGELAGAVNAMAEEVERMLESKRQLLFAVSHELRSPITRARLALELLAAPDKQALQDELDEMQRLVADLLEGERLSARHAVLQRESCDLRALIEATLEEHFAAQRPRIRRDLPAALPELSLDPVRIKLLLRNLLANALAHGGPGEVTVAVQPRAGSVRLTVSDRGPGIAPEHLARVTEPFYRVEQSRDRSSGGVGLGLYLAQRIAVAHGGELQLVSPPGGGLAVNVDFPLPA